MHHILTQAFAKAPAQDTGQQADLSANAAVLTETDASFASVFQEVAEPPAPPSVEEPQLQDASTEPEAAQEKDGAPPVSVAEDADEGLPIDVKTQGAVKAQVSLTDTELATVVHPHSMKPEESALLKKDAVSKVAVTTSEFSTPLHRQVEIPTSQKGDVLPQLPQQSAARLLTGDNRTDPQALTALETREPVPVIQRVTSQVDMGKSALRTPLDAALHQPNPLGQQRPHLALPQTPTSEIVGRADAEAMRPQLNTSQVTSSNVSTSAVAQMIPIPVSSPLTGRSSERPNQKFDPPSPPASNTNPKPSAPPLWVATQPILNPTQAKTLKTATVSEADPLSVPRGETTGTTTAQIAQTLPTRMELPHQVARQIAEALQHMPNRPVEITLSPEELGRVRLGVSTSEGNIMVVVLTERPETSDLMRRHISALETAFQELGYSDISFSFGGRDNAQTASDESGQNNHQNTQGHVEDAGTQNAHIHLNSAPLTGVDIRL